MKSLCLIFIGLKLKLVMTWMYLDKCYFGLLICGEYKFNTLFFSLFFLIETTFTLDGTSVNNSI